MPATPRPRLKAAPSSARSGQSSGESGGQKTSGPSPSASSVRRTPKQDSLRIRLSKFYTMMGMIMTPFSRFIPNLEPLGKSLGDHADEAANAWVDLAEENPKVKAMLEDMLGASTWGNVIGVHFVIAMSAMPQQATKIAENMMPENVTDPVEMMKQMGMSQEEIEKALKLAEGVVSDRAKEPDIDEKQAADMQAQMNKLRQQAGMATPEQMGVQNDGQDQYSGPQNTGGLP